MRFDVIPVQSIKSISQRTLALHWQALHGRSGLPRFADFSPGERAHDPRGLLVWTVDEQSDKRAYRLLYGGAHVFEAFGADADVNSVPERLRDIFTTGLDECVTSANIVYMSIATSDPEGHRVECERLLLPFGDHGKVTHVMASLQLVSIQGSFERSTIVRQFELEADLAFCGRIEPASAPMPRSARPAAKSQIA
jgi:hypothetical protein